MVQGQVVMSHREVDRLAVMQQLLSKQIRQGEAARLLGVSVRQVKRLLRRYRQEGATGLIAQSRARRPPNARPEAMRQAVLELVRTRYADFGPTLAAEQLATRHGTVLSHETLRTWMTTAGLWVPRARRRTRLHPGRPRRPCVGELVQIDGSLHAWFEERGPTCTLIVFIDDATSRLLALRFARAETIEAYMQTLAPYLGQYGRPVAFYSDKHSIFRVNRPDQEGELTQFTRALRTLDIEPIHAHSPQAKGRVERANQTLQDRLVKELRLQGVSDIDAANAFLPAFLAAYNARFAKAPVSPVDAHRPLLHTPAELTLILSLHHCRRLSKDLAFQFQNRTYQLTGPVLGARRRGTPITVCEAFDSSVTLLHEGQILPYRVVSETAPLIALEDDKTVRSRVTEAQRAQAARPHYKPAPDHPWKQGLKSGTVPPAARNRTQKGTS